MLIQVDYSNGITSKDTMFKPSTFKALGRRESEMEEFIRQNIQLLFTSENAQGAATESLLIVGQQVSNSEKGRTDLVAIDGNGSLTLVEIKRDADDIRLRREAFEFQAIRYAANLATVKTPEQLVALIYAPYIQRHRGDSEFSGYKNLTPTEIAKRKLDSFLSANSAFATFNQKQRIMLIASGFDVQTLSAVAWLVANNVDITCFTLTPGKLLEQDFINIEKILPPPLLDEFLVEFPPRVPAEEKGGGPSRPTQENGVKFNLPKIGELMEAGLLKGGDLLKLRGESEADSKAKILNSNQVEHGGKVLSFNQWGQKVKGWSSINIYDWAELLSTDPARPSRPLTDLRWELHEAREKQRREATD
jgi:hypothetical protein